jgi:cytochrome o ubiquinol oxidase subunit IV
MSSHDAHSHDVQGHDAHHADAPHFSMKDYLTGFVLSVVLTAIPFYLVMTGMLGDKTLTGLVIAAFAAVQVVVHMIYFLHMNTKSEGGWNFLALAFTVIIVGIALSGSLWVMYHLNHNMMPMPHMNELP